MKLLLILLTVIVCVAMLCGTAIWLHRPARYSFVGGPYGSGWIVDADTGRPTWFVDHNKQTPVTD